MAANIYHGTISPLKYYSITKKSLAVVDYYY